MTQIRADVPLDPRRDYLRVSAQSAVNNPSGCGRRPRWVFRPRKTRKNGCLLVIILVVFRFLPVVLLALVLRGVRVARAGGRLGLPGDREFHGNQRVAATDDEF